MLSRGIALVNEKSEAALRTEAEKAAGLQGDLAEKEEELQMLEAVRDKPDKPQTLDLPHTVCESPAPASPPPQLIRAGGARSIETRGGGGGRVWGWRRRRSKSCRLSGSCGRVLSLSWRQPGRRSGCWSTASLCAPPAALPHAPGSVLLLWLHLLLLLGFRRLLRRCPSYLHLLLTVQPNRLTKKLGDSLAAAPPKPSGGGGGGGGEGEDPVEQLFLAIDTNRDGSLDRGQPHPFVHTHSTALLRSPRAPPF